MSYARSRQRSRQQDERLIERDHEDCSYGMARQADVEGTDLPKNAMADGINVRFLKKGWMGRPGSKLYEPADFGVTITDNHDATLSAAIQSGGELYEANGSVVPSVGDVFVVYGTGDTTDNALQTSKGYAVRKYDCFEVTNATLASEAVRYIGRIGVPALPGYGDTPSTEFTASQAGTTVTATTAVFDSSHVNHYINWNDGTRCLITQYLTTTTVTVSYSQTKSSTTMCYIQPGINATFYHEAVDKVVGLFGKRLYVSKRMPFAGFTEIVPIGSAPAIRPADSSQSLIFADGDDAILINQKAMYRIKLTAQPYYYKMNATGPSVRITDVNKHDDVDYKFKYNYTYSLARIIGGTIYKDRTDGDEGVTLEHESPPVKRLANDRDWGYVWADTRVGNGSKTYGKLTGSALAGAYTTAAAWSAITNAEWSMSVSGATYNCGADLGSVANMSDLCATLQYAARTHLALKDVEFEYVTDHIVVSTGDDQTISYFGTVAGGSGTDISANLKLTSGNATITTPSRTAAKVVYYLTMPQDDNGNYLLEWQHATHYPVYRTSNCADLPEGTEAHDYRWTQDIPVAKAMTGSTSVPSGTPGSLTATLTLTYGYLEDEDTTAVIYAEDGSYCTITEVLTSTTATVGTIRDYTGVEKTTAISSQSMAIGGGTVFTASQSGTTITVSSGKSFAAVDEGKLIFWADGYTSIIKTVTNSTTLVALTAATHVASGATCDPRSRVFSDIISDDNIEQDYSRYAGWPLRIRYQEAMPAGGLGAIVPGYLFVARQGTNSYQYCTRLYKWHMGYYNPGYQKYERIVDGIQHFKNKDAGLLIYGSRKRYYLDTTLGTEVGETRVGENLTKLQDPTVQSNAVGTVPSSGAQELENGAEILVTQEPAVRIISPSTESENYAEGRIQKSDLQKMKNVYVGAYHAICGWFLFGKQEL